MGGIGQKEGWHHCLAVISWPGYLLDAKPRNLIELLP